MLQRCVWLQLSERAIAALWGRLETEPWTSPVIRIRRDATPAHRGGSVATNFEDRPEILGERLFPSLVELSKRWEDYYWRRVETPAVGSNRQHDPKYVR